MILHAQEAASVHNNEMQNHRVMLSNFFADTGNPSFCALSSTAIL
jgi:hypothetical protein